MLRAQERFQALLWGRRSGKTDLEVKDMAAGLLELPESENLFIGLTADSAARNFWRPLERINRRLQLGLRFDNSKMRVRAPNDAILQVIGSETVRDLEKPRGAGYRRIRIDECGAMRPSYLEYLVTDVLEAAMMDDVESTLWLSGTAGLVPVGFWHDVSTGVLPGWRVTYATAADNPHVDFERFVHEPIKGLLARRNWTEDNPIYRREYLAEWVIDPTRVVYRFLRARNVVPALPKLGPYDEWVKVLGLDFGVGDATAASVLAYPRNYGRCVYLIDSWQEAGLTTSEAAAKIKITVDKHRPEVIVGDVNGLGKPYQLEWNRRFPGVEMRAANKADKRGTLEIVSDLLHTARHDPYDARNCNGLMALEGNEGVCRQWATLQWDDERKDIAEGQDDDGADSAMYAAKECPAYLNALRPDVPEDIDVRGTTHQYRRRKGGVPKELEGFAKGWRGR